MEKPYPPSPQQIYTPAVGIARITTKHAMGKVFVTALNAPDHICGIARRVGYTGKQDSDLAIYRLKVKTDPLSPVTTLPKLFVVEGGVFVDYEEWSMNRKPV